VCVEAALNARRTSLDPKVLESPLLGYKRAQGGSEKALVVEEARQEERCP
jgi:hypothetical protein